MNSNENTKNTFESYFSFYNNINNKIFLYKFKFYKDLMVKYHIKKLIEIKNSNENNLLKK